MLEKSADAPLRDDARGAARPRGSPRGARTASGPDARLGRRAGNVVAVLAFTNITKSPEDDWLATGIMETVTSDLKGVPDLAVIGCERVCEVEKRLTGASHRESSSRRASGARSARAGS